MKIILAGGTGQLGHLLARAFEAGGDEVVLLTRTPDPALPWRTVRWDGGNPGPWTTELEGAGTLINLAGRSVNCRYTSRNRRAILDSRVASTTALGEAIAHCAAPPKVWLQSSTATLYAHRYDAPNDEARGLIGGNEPGAPETWRFSIGVAKAWEAATRRFLPLPQTRCILMRTAIVMSREPGGPLDLLSRLTRCGLGGHSGNGRQYVSWIHEADFVRAVQWLIADSTLEGPVNLAAPHPLPNREFMAALRTAWGVPFGLPATRWMLEAGAWVLRSETELILKSRRVTPGRLVEAGFSFRFPQWAGAAHDLATRWREPR